MKFAPLPEIPDTTNNLYVRPDAARTFAKRITQHQEEVQRLLAEGKSVSHPLVKAQLRALAFLNEKYRNALDPPWSTPEALDGFMAVGLSAKIAQLERAVAQLVAAGEDDHDVLRANREALVVLRQRLAEVQERQEGRKVDAPV